MSLSASPTRFPHAVEQVRALFDRSPLPLMATEGHAHTVRYVNPAFCWLTGQPAEAVVGSPLRSPLGEPPQIQDAAAVTLLDRAYATGAIEFAVDLARIFGNARALAQATAIHLPCVVWPILGVDERPAGLVIQVSAPPSDLPRQLIDGGGAELLRDVNARLLVAGLKAQEQADVELTLRVEAEAALNVRDEFMSIAAHELRTPVTGIKASGQLALRTMENTTLDRDRIVKYLRGIVGGANRLVLLINDLMDVSRMRSGALVMHPLPLPLGPLVIAVAQRYAETCGERHQVTTNVPAEPVMVSGDAMRLEQILDNLLSNAVKYSPAGGDIHVSLERLVDGVVLTVRDAGIGLPPGAAERIFEPFGRAANASRQGLPGMGLGLHICRQIAAAHGGRIWAESPGEGMGMTVGLWLPTT
jgi:signal transduction histidine kinase